MIDEFPNEKAPAGRLRGALIGAHGLILAEKAGAKNLYKSMVCYINTMICTTESSNKNPGTAGPVLRNRRPEPSREGKGLGSYSKPMRWASSFCAAMCKS